MRPKIRDQDTDDETIRYKLPDNKCDSLSNVFPIKMEMGNDIKVPFLKTSPCEIKKDDNTNIPSSSRRTEFNTGSNSKNYHTLIQPISPRAHEKKNHSFLKKESISNNRMPRDSKDCNGDKTFLKSCHNSNSTDKKHTSMIKRLQSDLTPQAIFPASTGRRIHTSVLPSAGDSSSHAKRTKTSQLNESLKSCGSNMPEIIVLKQEPPNNDHYEVEANFSTFSLPLKNHSSASLVSENTTNKIRLKPVKFKHENTPISKRPNGTGIKRPMNEHLLSSSKKSKNIEVSSAIVPSLKTSPYGESPVKTCISSTVGPSSSVPSRARGGKREIDQLYKSLKEINWARDKEFTSLLYAKNSVRHSDRNSSIKATITDRSKKLAKLGKVHKDLTKQKQPKLLKGIKPPVTVRPKQNLTTPMQKKIQRNIVGEHIHSQQHLKIPMKQKNASLAKHHEISKKIKPKAISQRLKMSFQRKKPLSKHHDISKKVKSKAVSHQLKMSQKKAISKRCEITKKNVLKAAPQHLKILQKKPTIPKSNGSPLNEDKEIKIIYQKLKPSASAVKKKIPIQSVKPIVDHEKKNVFAREVKISNSKSATSTSASWKNVMCDINMSLFTDNDDPHVLSALRNNPELRVKVTPLESTQPWASDFNFQNKLQREFDAHNRRILQEKMNGVYTSIDHSHVSSILQEVHDSIGIFPSTTKLPEEKTKKSVRSSVRQSECAFRYKEIVVKKHDNYLQVVLVPNIQKQNSLTIEAIKELKEAFVAARKDTNCNAVLLSSSGSFFCSGIDLGQLYGSNKKHVAEDMASSLKDLILTLALFPKPVVAAVNGSAIGLGVSLLMYCDIILASDKATFCIPAAKMGYVPEGGVTLTLPQVVGSSCAIEMLLHGKRLTAQQALKFGMVSEILWPTQLMEEVIPRVRSLAEQNLQVMEITKTMVRCHLWEKLPAQLDHEWRLLPTQWLSTECQQKIKKHLQTGWLFEY